MKIFDLEKVVTDICTISEVQNVKVFLIKVTKTKSEIYKQEADDDTKKILLDSIKMSLQSTAFKNREIMEYDSVISKKNTHELVDVSLYENISNMLSEFNDEKKHILTTKGLDESKFHLYMISVKNDNSEYKIIGQFTNVLELSKKFLFGNFTNNKINITEKNNVIGFSKKIDLLVINDEIIVINQAEAKFESLFKMNKLFSEEAISILKNNEKIKVIFDKSVREKLIEKVGSGKRMASRLIKIVADEERFNQTVENISEIIEITSDPTDKFYSQIKDVHFEDGKLSVIDGQEIQLINAISDAPYTARISKTLNTDEARM